MHIIPAVDVLDGSVVRLQKGDYDRVTHYGDDPVAAARSFTDRGIEMVHVVDLGAARSGRQSPGLWESLGAAALPFQAAGGLRSADAASTALAVGAARVISGTTAVWDPSALEAMVEAAGDRLVAAVDVRNGRAVGTGWTDAGRNVEEVTDRLAEAGVARLMITSVATDGMLTGPDLGLLAWAAGYTNTPIIGSGGVGSLDDIRAAAELGIEALIVGRALYEGRFTIEEAVGASA